MESKIEYKGKVYVVEVPKHIELISRSFKEMNSSKTFMEMWDYLHTYYNNWLADILQLPKNEMYVEGFFQPENKEEEKFLDILK